MSSLEQLLQAQPRLWRGRQHPHGQRTAPTGDRRLDAFLPGGGWPLGSLTELLTPPPGGGELSLVLPSVRRLTAEAHWVALVAPPFLPYSPALARAGVALSRVLIVQPEHARDAAWAAEQLLRSGGFRAVLSWLPHASTTQLRRLQLAAEAGHDAWALVYRPESTLDTASPAALRLHYQPADARRRRPAQLQVVKCRGANPGTLSLGGPGAAPCSQQPAAPPSPQQRLPQQRLPQRGLPQQRLPQHRLPSPTLTAHAARQEALPFAGLPPDAANDG
ncbi:MAG: translesion DNA synthesis-associated protein ImuA [Pseudomonadota bacterium]